MASRTIYYTASSLDGFIADSDNSLDWLMQLGEEPGTSYETFIANIGAVAMGSTTYEWLLANHVYAPDGDHPWPYTQPTWIFTSRKLQIVPSADIRFVRGSVASVHAEMLKTCGNDKNIWLAGGGDLAGQFYDAGLLDELIVQIASVTLASGAPLLPRRIAKPPLKLISVTQYGETYAELRYEVRK